ncbi:MAG: SDR family oxidoreductase, partial [Bacillota bacterium]|nr:SDR family oxidoreductase [Bacillota bacterium]
RGVTQDDIGGSALYLLSNLSSGMTGEVIYVDCGYNIMGI